MSPQLEESVVNSSPTKKSRRSFFDSKHYLIGMIFLALFYFFDVFVGMFVLYYQFNQVSCDQMISYSLLQSNQPRVTDIIEIILLGVILIDIFTKTYVGLKHRSFKVTAFVLNHCRKLKSSVTMMCYLTSASQW